jgi:23S rRNA pseudouridine1911/1915/1917 synthase
MLKKITPAPQIIAETSDYLVINKPAGLAVHSGGNLKGPTLIDWLIANYPKIKDVGEDLTRPGLVHRLDKNVSGLMVVAKNNKSFLSLKNQFKERSVIKEYIALVYGQMISDDGIIDFPITRSKSGYKMAALPVKTEDLLFRHHPRRRDQGNVNSWFKSRTALTEFDVIKKFINYTLVKVRIKTGRTHQIRVHFFAYGHPLVGDDLYYTKKTKVKNEKLKLNRVFLVSVHLGFKDLQEKSQSFIIDLPDELTKVLPKH